MNARALTYEAAGATSPRESIWSAAPAGLRRFEQTISIGHGDALWDAAARAVANWEVKQRSGFRVHPQRTVSEGAEFVISFGWGPLAVHEPVRIVAVVDTDTRRGFAYGTLPGHPVSGEEAFIVHRDADGTVFLTLRSLTRPAPSGFWRRIFPVLLLAQKAFRRRYLRSLLP
ncbi:DUF1990 domain-containing protein [Mycobacteroides abscessus subsp. bolletii]|uniref:DUF1990 family protein n=1 Tax=Mycobacteroides abscessus TaxID=36809 RepID=UPI0019D1C31A|nr:DUF1990 domain-containing protein [Mycobacteroides abscessus]MBN7302569.1 DUF1990 domain-containing protein [Mycobacteroides abscessus subsp. bolletii]